MRSIACTLLVLICIRSALGEKGNYWWLFPKFNENGNATSENYYTSLIRNGTDLVNATLNDNVLDLDANLEEEIDLLIGSDDSSGISSSNSSVTNEVLSKSTDSDQDGKLDWITDKESLENGTEVQDKLFNTESTNGQESEEDNVTEVAQENGSETDSSQKEDASKTKEEDDDENAFSGEDEIDEENEDPEPIIEQDVAIHENGDPHPSSRIESEKNDSEIEEEIDNSTYDIEEKTEEETNDALTAKDVAVHVDGDAHPSSEIELKTNDSQVNDDDTQSKDFEEENEGLEWDPIANGNPNNEEKSDDPSGLDYVDSNGTLDFDNVGKDESIVEATTKDYKRKSVKSSTQITGTENEDDDDDILIWVDMESSSSKEKLESPKETTQSPIVAPIAPIFTSPICDFTELPFDLTTNPTNTTATLHGKNLTLLCELTALNTSNTIPHFRLTWFFKKANCQKDGVENSDACVTVLSSAIFESPNSSYVLPHSLKNLNHPSHTGTYTCELEIYSCQSQNLNVTQASKSLDILVYVKPNYGYHIGILSAACVLLIAVLVGLAVYARRIQSQSKNRYQELLSSVDIQYYPSKVLELPNSVYNPTTTMFTRMSASTFSSKSSFTSNEDAQD